jgi:hypothetical protein
MVGDRGDRSAEATAAPKHAAGGRVISDEPIDLSVLDRLDGGLGWSVEEMLMPATTLRELRVDATLKDGGLSVDPITGSGAHGGTANGRLSVRPSGDGYGAAARVSLVNGRLDMSSVDDDPDDWPTIDVDLDLTGTGRSPRELAASANGRVAVNLGEGVMDSSVVDLLAGDVLITLLEALNPFGEDEKISMLECAVIVVGIDDGVARFDPVAIRSKRLTMLGDGKIDLATEKIDFEWVTKPRKGVGISASMITNPYIKLGGTLARPSVEMKPLEAAASTGLAVATGGLSLLGKGLLDRITAEQNVCKQARKRAEKKLAEQASGSEQ